MFRNGMRSSGKDGSAQAERHVEEKNPRRRAHSGKWQATVIHERGSPPSGADDGQPASRARVNPMKVVRPLSR